MKQRLSRPKVLPILTPEEEGRLLSHPPLLRHLLHHRGITKPSDIERFLQPDFEKHTHDPLLLKDMEKAVSRILGAMKRGERIVIWSDYDADGIPGAVVLHDFFKKIGYENFENYIPHRGDEGFGLNEEGLGELSTRGARLVITVDCGTADVAEVAAAKKLGIDVIITDHHLPNGTLPEAFAVINPKQADCGYPEKILCGAGVAFKLAQALARRLALSPSPELGPALSSPSGELKAGWEKWLLDMVGIATLSDMVPLTGENRVFARYGLLVLRKSPRVGLRRLLALLKIRQEDITEDDIGFSISPRLNAASRMGVPMDAFRLLSTTDPAEADELARHLNRMNDERKGIVAATVKEVRKIIATRYAGSERKVIVIGNPSWRPSLLGLVASALSGEHGKPVFLWGREENSTLKGSCRSDGNINVFELMKISGDFFEEFGGHAASGGFTVSADKVHFLEEELERAYEKARAAESGEPELVDRRLSLSEVGFDTYRLLESLAPFGVGNPKPTFLFEGVSVERVIRFGKEKNHLKLILGDDRSAPVSAVKFFADPEKSFARPVREGDTIDLVASIEKSTFGGSSEIRLRIADLC